ncbi:MAG: hypothetical protein WBC43_04470, partial [Olleya sp.]
MKILTFLMLFCTLISFGQVGINTTTPDPSSILDVTSTDKGLLIPRIALTSTSDVSTITSPSISLLIYNTATVSNITPGYFYWDGTEWSKLATTKTVNSAWSTIGNAGTDDTVNFIGTTDNQDLVFKRNNIQAGLLNSNNTSFGVNSLPLATT